MLKVLMDTTWFFPGVPVQKWLPIVLAGIGAESDRKETRKRGSGMKIQGRLKRGQIRGMEPDGT